MWIYVHRVIKYIFQHREKMGKEWRKPIIPGHEVHCRGSPGQPPGQQGGDLETFDGINVLLGQ